MNKTIIFILIFVSVFLTAQAQNKEILGDTAFWYSGQVNLYEKIGLPNLVNSTADFHFRFTTYDTRIIDIWKENDSIKGTITNYISHTYGFRNKKHEIVSETQYINRQVLAEVYRLVSDSAVLHLPSSKMIKGWQFGADGSEYFVEYADKQTYWFKNYWTPSGQGSLPEAIFLISFIQKLDTLLNLTESYKNFRENLPKTGCYSAGMMTTCYAVNPFYIGYSGSIKMPLGFYFGKNFGYIGKVATNVGFRINYRSNGKNDYDLLLMAVKYHLFFKKNKLNDVILYQYHQRHFDDMKFYNDKISYTLRFSDLSIGAGADLLNSNEMRIGGLIYASYNFPHNIWVDVESSLFKQNINYRVDISKHLFRILNYPVEANVFYEKFQKRSDVGLGLTLSLY